MSRRVLILSAAVGAGHLRAAEAVELAVRQLDATAVVENIDVLTLTNATFRKFYGRAYLDLVNPIPGQESRNSDFLLENGAAIKINNIATLPYKLARLLDDPGRLTLLKSNARRLGKPQAAFDVARAALQLND